MSLVLAIGKTIKDGLKPISGDMRSAQVSSSDAWIAGLCVSVRIPYSEGRAVSLIDRIELPTSSDTETILGGMGRAPISWSDAQMVCWWKGCV